MGKGDTIKYLMNLAYIVNIAYALMERFFS